MIKILKEVATNRLQNNVFNFQIQLSSTLMRKAVEDVNMMLPENNQQRQDPIMNHFAYNMFGHKWLIINRAYRDDTNDEDVEEVLYKFACQV